MSSLYDKFKSIFSSTLNLVRVELFFGAAFGQFYALLFHALSDIDYSQTIVNIYSVVFIVVLVFSFIKPKFIKEYRLISNALFLFGSIYILFVAFINEYDTSAFFLVIFNYVFVSFSMPNVKILGVVSAFFYWTFIMSYFLLEFKAETPFYISFLSLLFINIAAYFIVFARNVYKARIKEREQLLNHVFNNSNDGLLLIDNKTFAIKDCNNLIEKIFNTSKEKIVGSNILEYKLKGKRPFYHLKDLGKETVEFESKEIIHYQKKKLEYLNYSYLLVQVKRFKNRVEMNNIFRLTR